MHILKNYIFFIYNIFNESLMNHQIDYKKSVGVA